MAGLMRSDVKFMLSSAITTDYQQMCMSSFAQNLFARSVCYTFFSVAMAPGLNQILKRDWLLEMYKNTEDYAAYLACRTIEDPPTPRLCTGKREWEAAFFKWKSALKSVRSSNETISQNGGD